MNQIKLSKFLSLLLRHKPEALHLNMDANGWVDLKELISKMNQSGRRVTYEEIVEVVENNNKQRFKLDVENYRIRANQGHSIDVDVELKATTPPATLYHGTSEKSLGLIQASGLKKMNRQHVHLSEEYDTAVNVGSRHGKVYVLKVDCTRMLADGYVFYLSENKVWLTDHVPVEYIIF